MQALALCQINYLLADIWSHALCPGLKAHGQPWLEIDIIVVYISNACADFVRCLRAAEASICVPPF